MKPLSACCLILLCSCINVSGQKNIIISPPSLKISDHQLIIKYDIQHSTINDVFRIWVMITDSAGQKYNATSLTGDIGNNVSGGPDKIVIWDMEKDGYYRNIEVYVEIKAEKVEPVAGIPDKDIKADVKKTKERESVKEYKTIGLLTRSVVMPGWGQSVVSDKKPYYYCLMGLIGYGCIGTSIYLNYKANDNYDQYKETYVYDLDNAVSLYDKATAQYQTSNILGFCAAAIWIADIAWAAVSAARYRSQLKTTSINNYRIYLTCDALTLKPGIQLIINF
ncbi:MAG: hypothetical protein JW973_11315 [Bacteroidales bacterium]|nr:hypothetical protein [Bacteroidales bacterium]